MKRYLGDLVPELQEELKDVELVPVEEGLAPSQRPYSSLPDEPRRRSSTWAKETQTRYSTMKLDLIVSIGRIESDAKANRSL